MKILLLEDDPILQEIIEEYLIELGYKVDCFYDGDSALDAAMSKKYDMLLLDVNVPEIDGFEMLEYLREIKNQTPAIFITSLKDYKHLQRAFNMGAQDYLKKPFELEELNIRITHHLERSNKSSYKLKEATFYPKKELIKFIDGKEVVLKTKESLILHYLLQQEGKIISFDEIIENIWSQESTPTYATIRTYIKNLRKLLGYDIITNIKGKGYKIELN